MSSIYLKNINILYKTHINNMSFMYSKNNKILFISSTYNQQLYDINKNVEEIIFDDNDNENENNYYLCDDCIQNQSEFEDEYYWEGIHCGGCDNCFDNYISIETYFHNNYGSRDEYCIETSIFNQKLNKGDLPPLLTHLTLGASFNQEFNNLPESILELEIHSCYEYIDNLPYFIDTLIIIFDYGDQYNKNITNLPMGIKQIKINDKEKLYFIKKIPFNCLITDLENNTII